MALKVQPSETNRPKSGGSNFRGIAIWKILVTVAGLAAFIATPALAADMAVKAMAVKAMAVKAPLPAAAPGYGWTGWYAGANIGGGWGKQNISFSPNDLLASAMIGTAVANGGVAPPPTSSFNTSGLLGGLQLGYNWQFNRTWLVGLETDFDGSNIKGSTTSNSGGTFLFFTNTADATKWFGTVRARLGFLPSENFLAYLTGGFAYGRVDHDANSGLANGGSISASGLGLSFNCTGPGTCFSGASSKVEGGWTAGGGFEYAFRQHWTVKAEYLFVSLAGSSLTENALSIIPGTAPSSFNIGYGHTNFNVARVGLNYHFR